MKLFIKYGFAFFLTAFGLSGVLVLIHLFVSDQASFSLILADLGAFGSFLSGVGTIIAATAAVIGVDNWVKQLKFGKYLEVIWSSKVAIRKVHSSEMYWYIANYSLKQNPSPECESDLKSKAEKLEFDFQVLKDSFHQLDQIVIKNQFLWANYASQLETTWLKIKWHMEKNSLASKDLPKLNAAFSENYNDLMDKLESIEAQFGK
jgi:hypothetical protein